MSGAPWSVKGIDPKAREVAKDMARRSGMTLGEWLNTVITRGDDETGEAEAPAPRPEPIEESRFSRPSSAVGAELTRVTGALDRLAQRIEAAEHRSSLAISGVDQSVQGVLARLEDAERTQSAATHRIETVERDQVAVAARLDAALMALRDEHEESFARLRKMEAEGAGPRSAEALKALETALGKVASQLYDGESRTKAVLGEIGREFDNLSRDLDVLSSRPDAEAVVERALADINHRLERAQSETSAAIRKLETRPDAESVVQSLLAGVISRLERAEGQTAAAIQRLEASFAGLDERLQSAERRPVYDPAAGEARLEQLAADLSARFEASRAEMAARLDEAAKGRLAHMDEVVRDLTGHVEAAERRSAQAIEKMGQEVLRIADSLGKRMIGLETRTAEAVEQVGADVARVAHTVESRTRESDRAHAEALEKLGGDIARISERLSERIAHSEKRNAQAIDDIGEQVVRATDRLNQRYETSANELAERIRQSDERAVRFLEEAREKIEERLTETQKRIVEQVTPLTRSVVDVSTRLEQVEATASYMPPFGQATPAAPPSIELDDPFLAPGPTPVVASVPRAEPVPQMPVDDPLSDRELFADRQPAPTLAPARVAPSAAAEPDFLEVDEDDPFAPFEPAAASPRSIPEPGGASGAFEADASPFEPSVFDSTQAPPMTPYEPLAPSAPGSTRDLLDRARAAARAQTEAAPPAVAAKSGLFGRIKLPKPKGRGRHDSTVRTALIVSATAAALAATTAGSIIYFQEGPEADRQAEGDPADPVLYGEAARANGPVRAASLMVEPTPAAVVAPNAADSERAAAAYADAVRALTGGDQAAGVSGLKSSANLGSAAAQLHLARLYETGDAGLPVDVAESRRWTERAAAQGDRRAMHNLGLLYFEGKGGRKDLALAKEWFRRAADLGLSDSQYNLGLVYENGYGVTKNVAEAYKWYVIAARNGDDGGRSSAERLQRQVSPEAQAAAERAALAFRAGGPGQTVVAGPVSADAAAAQRALSRLGYYRGPTDGRASPALSAAAQAWQRDQGLAADGVIDDELIAGLARAG